MKNILLKLGVGPIYVSSIILVTIIFIYLSNNRIIPSIQIRSLNYLFIFIGIFLMILGIYMWIKAVLYVDLYASIDNNQLLTSGIYSFVRNPIYSAFMFVCSGIILIFNNVLLFVLPIIFWMYLTVLIKITEENWLRKRHKQDYIEYCKNVNRCIPWFKNNFKSN